MKLTWSEVSLSLRDPFRTATVTRLEKRNVIVCLSHDGVDGWGEAAPVAAIGQSPESTCRALSAIAELLGDDPHSVESIIGRLVVRFDADRAAIAAVDAALHDWLGKRYGISTVRWLGLDPAATPPTSYTISIDDPQRIAERIAAAAEFPILKIKLEADRVRETIALVRSLAPGKALRVDANTSWTVPQALELLPFLAENGVELVEQPLPAGAIAGLRTLKEAGVCPIVADESCRTPADVIRLAGAVNGINVKLYKCGGLRQAMRMILIAKELGLKVMLGCTIESSLGIAAAAQLAPLADWIDLDGHLLTSNDPFIGIGGAGGRLTPGRGPGLGVRPIRQVDGADPQSTARSKV